MLRDEFLKGFRDHDVGEVARISDLFPEVQLQDAFGGSTLTSYSLSLKRRFSTTLTSCQVLVVTRKMEKASFALKKMPWEGTLPQPGVERMSLREKKGEAQEPHDGGSLLPPSVRRLPQLICEI